MAQDHVCLIFVGGLASRLEASPKLSLAPCKCQDAEHSFSRAIILLDIVRESPIGWILNVVFRQYGPRANQQNARRSSDGNCGCCRPQRDVVFGAKAFRNGGCSTLSHHHLMLQPSRRVRNAGAADGPSTAHRCARNYDHKLQTKTRPLTLKVRICQVAEHS